MTHLWRNYGLSITLAVLFLVSLAVQVAAQLAAGDGWVEIVAAVAENHQSEYLQLFAFVLLSSWLIHRGSPQSRDGSERLERKVDTLTAKVIILEGKLDRLAPSPGGRRPDHRRLGRDRAAAAGAGGRGVASAREKARLGDATPPP